MRRDLGDFQTPKELATAVLRALSPGPIGSRWPRVLEPTCGAGSFLRALLDEAVPPAELIGIEIQHVARRHGPIPHASKEPARESRCASPASSSSTSAPTCAGKTRGPLLVVGNPPWVTSAELGPAGQREPPGPEERQDPARDRRHHRGFELRHRRGDLAQADRGPGRRSARRSRCCARPRWPGACSSSPIAANCRSTKRPFTRSTPRNGSAPRSGPACSG